MKKFALKVLMLVAGLFLLSTSHVWVDGICEADLDYDGKVLPSDAMIFLNEWKKKDRDPTSPAPVPKTGSTIDDATGEDGGLRKGVTWPNPRFTDNGDETVTDNLTGLMWIKNAQQISGRTTWSEAITACNDLNFATHTDWRLPNVRELQSLIHYGYYDPAIPNTEGNGKCTNSGDPFTNVQSGYYWSSTSVAHSNNLAWIVGMRTGYVDHNGKSATYPVLPVRGGQ